jgi:hypothetical protein
MAKEILTDDGQLEEVDMDEAKDDNKKLGMPAIDDEEGRDDHENDEIEGGTKKNKEEKPKKSNASAKAEAKAKKEEDDEDYEDDDEDEDDEEEVESKSKKESKKSKKEGMPPWLDKDKKDDDDEDDDEEKESKKAKKEGKPPWLDKDDDEDDDEEKESKKAKKEDIDVDVSEDVAALIDGEDLSEDFKKKAATIFEAAVKSKISKIRKQIREDSKKYLEVKTDAMQTEMTEKMDEYMNYVVKEWMEENKLAVEQGVRNEVTESFISGLKKLFEEHYIDVPSEKEDIFESLVQEVAELETKLDEQTEKHMDTAKELNTYKAKDVFHEITDGMVDTDIEKMKELTEDVDYESDEQYKEKLNIIKNSYFKSDKKLDDNKKTAGTNKKITDGQGDSQMDSVMTAISNLSKRQGK